MAEFRPDLLAGKTSMVIGGTSGIGLGIAKVLASLGSKLAVASRSPEKAARAAADIGTQDCAIGLTCDVRDYQSVEKMYKQAFDRFGAFDIVVASAAGNFGAPALGMSANGFKVVVDIDLNGTFNCFRAGYQFLRRPGASLIAITAGQAVNPILFQSHVCAAKAGVNQLIRVLAMEWGPSGVRINAVSPGPIARTEGMKMMQLDEARTKAFEGRLALRRFGRTEEVGNCVVFLASDAASYVTGTILNCDGGYELGDASDRPANSGPI
jgi:NAD(P)-dependent dehydrogenase (short-subunit alcohol dehydrogenase family)